ncbi:Pkinase-domain-containing protein [Laetiporus sulphureus 93-53]|uniref:non-specific serine/threonine protein kinase n=1 Tax=Laetiporus sulphureus 93-53 TaxID=1314785 RepID=A0A165FHH4_9APHY|nr:Pkinase-domain-containing protein [Laetiporus sulphureus 93-53]KZT08979.1 Pkinase-domain-containing protein [Laetiporus sulphureus 93-53]
MAMVEAAETTQAESEGADSSDKPPQGGLHSSLSSSSQSTSTATAAKSRVNGSKSHQSPAKQHAAPVTTSGMPTATNGVHVPLPPPDTKFYQKAPGHTRKELEDMHRSDRYPYESPVIQRDSSSTTGSITPSSSSSLSASESDGWSLPSTQPPSRAPSMSSGVSGGKLSAALQPLTQTPSLPKTSSKKELPPPKEQPPDSTALRISSTPSKSNGVSEPSSTGTARPAKASSTKAPSLKASSVSSRHSQQSESDTGGQKFSLKDLLNSGPKLARKSSARSTGSSRKSDSDRGGKSSTGESTVSLLKKYGVCQKIAIGKGATSVVRLAHKWDRSEEKLYAVKEFRKRRKNETEKEYVKKLTAEFCISSTLHHVNIVETVDLVQDENQHWCEVMEFCPGGDLYAAIKRGGMSPAEVECSFKQMLTGVHYLHSQGVAHRDIKPENLFFDTKGHLKIGDYGASTVYRLPWETTVHMSTGLCGSEPYIAPEQFLGKPYDARLVDIWACGIVYYCLHFQELPWTVAQPTDHLFAAYVSACQTQSSCPPTINNLSPRACRPLIRKMLEPNPKQRALIDEIINHSWVQSIEVCYLMAKPTHVHVNATAMAQAQIQFLS